MSIILNVSGKIFKVSKDVISKSDIFQNLLLDCTTDDGEINIDRSSKLFKHVYGYLLDAKYPYPKKYHSELDYYLITYDIDLLYDPYKSLTNRIEILENKMFTMFDEIQSHFSEITRELKIVTDGELNFTERCSHMDNYGREYGFEPKRCHERCWRWQMCQYHFGKCVVEDCKNTPDGMQAYCRKHAFN
jgi:hypothetical protein